ncbi:DNA/RNA nuclease SfsA [Phormidium tenue]|uniref:Sugar fermentation stimulation protein homolog n=1 Tax=Phormidium tenue NIES-30 TaxID=549789 RepID=A0A1U7JB92_9CYAN|nr:DNA/RNA nuclease SfsA [Phormidium tenue]MBD2230114.1 DNA/RNA nuclease SfsA [Phormidium tenue FACHB-1052]OKH51054.1 sugar fermentation stimulation protein SfsA [Phormidium tenue NIES-30]
MPADWFYPFPPLIEGTVLKRYKRFFVDIELETGEVIVAHCPNTGPMTGVYHIGGRALVSYNPSPRRKLAYTWELTEVRDTVPTWAGVNTALPNRVVKSLLEARQIPELGDYTTIRPEVRYGGDGKSRIDFVLSGENTAPVTYVEVKNTTWAKGNLALFPDTVTTRGQKHLRELAALVPETQAAMLYFINRGDCTDFAPGDEADPTYGLLLREAMAKGVQILPCRFEITPAGLRYLGLATLRLH